MNEVTVKRVCNPGWKNCQMSELRAHIAELLGERATQDAVVKTLEGEKRYLQAKLDAVKAQNKGLNERLNDIDTLLFGTDEPLGEYIDRDKLNDLFFKLRIIADQSETDVFKAIGEKEQGE